MKKISFLFSFFLLASLQAQIELPQQSPTMQLKQNVGTTKVVINYSRPSMRGRTIFGDLVPYDEMWRTGANKNTTLFFGDDVRIQGKKLKAGTYALYTKPGKTSWTLYFYTETENWGVPEDWNPDKVAATITLPVVKSRKPLETFTISLDQITNNGATITLAWEKFNVPIMLAVPTREKAMKSITKALEDNPGVGQYFTAASYYFTEKIDLKQAEKWIASAAQMEDDKFWIFRLQSQILAALNKKEAALKAAQKSLQLAEEAGNADYIRMNKKEIKALQKK